MVIVIEPMNLWKLMTVAYKNINKIFLTNKSGVQFNIWYVNEYESSVELLSDRTGNC
jgi:hypothetical protein